MSKNYNNFCFVEMKLAEGNDRAGLGPAVVIRTGAFMHPDADDGKFVIDNNILASFKRNFDNNVRRIDKGELAIDYSHETEKKASGWIESVEHLREGDIGSLEIVPRWTKNGEQAILEEEFKFLSADVDLEYIDNESGFNHGPTLLGAGLVNRPHIKAMRALFSEKLNENKKPNKEFTMTEEEMLKKIGELEAIVAQLKGSMQAKETSLEEKDGELEVMRPKLETAEKQFKEATVKLTALEETGKKAAKEAKFSELLLKNKVVPAQKDAFMGMELETSAKFFENAAEVTNTDEAGKGTETERKEKEGGGKETAVQLVEKRADELQKKNTNLTLTEAYSEVMSNDKELSDKYEAETNG